MDSGAPFVSSVTTMFALFLAFHAAGNLVEHPPRRACPTPPPTWRSSGSTTRSAPAQLNLVDFRALLHRYVDYVSKDEWRKSRKPRRQRAGQRGLPAN
jgi:hypothetical protein